MTIQVLDSGEYRDATPEEIAEIEARANAPVPAVPRHITKLAFRNRFTAAEKVALEIAALDDPAAEMAARQQAAGLRALLADLAAADRYVNLDHGETRAGVQQLESMDIIAPGRAAVILDAEITSAEYIAP
jgi:hypothetical protein